MLAQKMTNDFFTLKDQTIRKIINLQDESDTLQIITDKYKYHLYHEQDCCEFVRLVKIIGDIDNILNEEIIFAEEDSGANDPAWHTGYNYDDHHTWTKFVLGTKNGNVEFWFLGESNGYYSEHISIKVEEIV
jgi:hypothetical protein